MKQEMNTANKSGSKQLTKTLRGNNFNFGGFGAQMQAARLMKISANSGPILSRSIVGGLIGATKGTIA